MRPAVYIPNYNGSRHLARALRSLREQTRPVDVVARRQRLQRRLGGPGARGVPGGNACSSWGGTSASGRRSTAPSREHPADPLILLNNDAECEPRFVEAMLDALDEGAADGRRRARSRNARPA